MRVLDHGSVELIETWGSDERIIEAARMSTGKGFQGWGPVHDQYCGMNQYPESDLCSCNPKQGDEKLLRYLYEHKHLTPFEMAGMIIEVKAPIFVFREWHRHRTQSYNEMSARYVPLPDENYLPEVENLMNRAIAAQQSGNKQAGAVNAKGDPIEEEDLLNWLTVLNQSYLRAQAAYEMGLKLGVPKELARLPIPVARYSRMRASANLRNWLQFLTLRMDPAAQWEIRQYANAVGALIAETFPRTYNLFDQERTE